MLPQAIHHLTNTKRRSMNLTSNPPNSPHKPKKAPNSSQRHENNVHSQGAGGDTPQAS